MQPPSTHKPTPKRMEQRTDGRTNERTKPLIELRVRNLKPRENYHNTSVWSLIWLICRVVGRSISLLVGPLVRPSVSTSRKVGKRVFLNNFCVCLSVCGGCGMWMGLGCPCPPVRNDIVTPRYLFIFTRNMHSLDDSSSDGSIL